MPALTSSRLYVVVDRDGPGLGVGFGVGFGVGLGVGLGVGTGVGVGVGVATFAATFTGVGAGVAVGVGEGVGVGEEGASTTRRTALVTSDAAVNGTTTSASVVDGAAIATAEHTRHNTKNTRIDRVL